MRFGPEWKYLFFASAVMSGMLALSACSNGNFDDLSQATPGTPLPTSTMQESATATAESAPTATQAPSFTPTSEPSPSFTPGTPGVSSGLQAVSIERIYPWFSPLRPTHMAEAPDGSRRLFVSEQDGRIVSISGDQSSEDGDLEVILDIQEQVSTSRNEEGLLGFAFHPEFASNGRFFVYYSASSPRRSVISEFVLDPGPGSEASSERIIMEIGQPEWNHNGGMLLFGPDGFLFVSIGDGGGGGDPGGHGQNVGTILGTIIRIDIDMPGVAYAIPADNPFADGALVNDITPLGEIWAYGLRNPWRLAFDPLTEDLWAGDVGQNRVEEVDLIVKGGNYGWNIKEGPDCFRPSRECEQVARGPLIEPVVSYTHDDGCSVTGGYVYRGPRMPSLFGAYVYADYCSGKIWALRHENGVMTEHLLIADTSEQIPAFGQTLDGEVYVLTTSSGIQRFVTPR